MNISEKEMAEQVIRYDLHKIIYRKKGNNYECFCPNCQKTFIQTKDQLKEIQHAHLCPECFTKIDSTTTKQEHILANAVRKERIQLDGFDGYWISFKLKFNQITYFKSKHIMKCECRNIGEYLGHEKTYVKDIHLGAYGDPIIPNSPDRCDGKWRNTRSNSYEWCLYRVREPRILSKKEYLQSIFNHQDVQIKSNQMKMMKEHLMNEEMIGNMLVFNINDYDLIYSLHTKLFKWNNPFSYVGENLNYYDAIYIAKNHLYIGDYVDYLKQCKLLGTKNKHPKDFQQEHTKLSRIIEEQSDKEKADKFDPLIQNLVSKLPTYSKDDYVIQPFHSTDELKKNANYMNNCIFGYLEDYAMDNVHLYKVIRKGKIVANIEVKNGQLIQCRARYNNDPPNKVDKVVESMMQEVSA